MAMGRRRARQTTLFVPHDRVRGGGGHPFYVALERVLTAEGFDAYVEAVCAPFYAARLGRPSLAPGVYFRCLLIGYFEGLGSERGIAWRVADSLSLREFLGLALDTAPPDHSTLSRTRRLLDIETHEAVFTWMLGVVAKAGLVTGQVVGVDATTLEANAALRSIVRRADGQSYADFLTALAQASGIATPTRADLARVDRRRRKKGSNAEWVHPQDPDAQIMKMKDGRTPLAHKQEQAVDLASGAVLAVTVAGGAAGDTQTLAATLAAANANLATARVECDAATRARIVEQVAAVVADKGYHSNAVLLDLAAADVRSYLAEPDRGRRCWRGNRAARDAVYANRRRIRGAHGQRLFRQRGERLERPFAHALETGGLRRLHVRGHANVRKRVLLQYAALNLGLLVRTRWGIGTPRGLQGHAHLAAALRAACRWCGGTRSRLCHAPGGCTPLPPVRRPHRGRRRIRPAADAPFTTGC